MIGVTPPVDSSGTTSNGIEMTDDFFISCNIDSKYLNYKTDSYRLLDLEALLDDEPVLTTSQILRNGNDLYVIANSSKGYVLFITLEDCFVIDNILTVGKATSRRITNDLTGLPNVDENRIHSAVFSRGYVFLSNRGPNTTTGQRIWKINPYDLTDVKMLELPNTAPYTGFTTEIRSYRNNIYALIKINSYNTGNAVFVRISENLNDYEVLFTVPAGTYTLSAYPPFTIYNDEIYVVSAPFSANFGVTVYNFAGAIVRQVLNIPTGETAPTTSGRSVPHWMTVINGKLIFVSIGTYSPIPVKNRYIARLDTKTLALEELRFITQGITHRNTVTKEGYIYLNGEYNEYVPAVNPPSQLLKVKYNDFDDLTVEISSYGFPENKGSYGSIDHIPESEAQLLKLSQFKNDLGGSATNLTYTASATQGVVNSDTGTDAVIPLATTTNAGLFSPSEKLALSNIGNLVTNVYLQDVLSYSTAEIDTGGTWTNDKPVYRIVLEAYSLNPVDSTPIDISSLDIEHLVSISGTANYVSGGNALDYDINSVKNLAGSMLTIEAYRNKTVSTDRILIAFTNFNRSTDAFTYFEAFFNVIIEYTKTTD